MDVVVKGLAFVVLGLILLTANIWYLGFIYRSFAEASLVVAPIRIVGGSQVEKGTDDVLARMLLVRIRSVMADFEQAQSSLKGEPQTASTTAPTGVVPTVFSQAQTVR